MCSQSTEFAEKESECAIDSILYVKMNINKYPPLRGLFYIKLLQFIEDKKADVNVDQRCIALVVTSAAWTDSQKCQHIFTMFKKYPHTERKYEAINKYTYAKL